MTPADRQRLARKLAKLEAERQKGRQLRKEAKQRLMLKGK